MTNYGHFVDNSFVSFSQIYFCSVQKLNKDKMFVSKSSASFQCKRDGKKFAFLFYQSILLLRERTTSLEVCFEYFDFQEKKIIFSFAGAEERKNGKPFQIRAFVFSPLQSKVLSKVRLSWKCSLSNITR